MPREDGTQDALSCLPSYYGFTAPAWTIESPIPTRKFVVDGCSGRIREGDTASWLVQIFRELTGDSLDVIRLDEVVGGYEQDITRDVILEGFEKLCGHASCIALTMAGPCGPWSVSKMRFLQTGDGPPPLFTAEHPDGVNTDDVRCKRAIEHAMRLAHAQTRLLRATLTSGGGGNGGQIITEHPMGRGANSEYPLDKCETHSTVYDTTPYVELRRDFALQDVYTDRGATGAETQKSTHLLVSSAVAPHARSLLGTLRSRDPSRPSMLGTNPDGTSRTKDSEVFTPEFAELYARSLILGCVAPISEEGGSNQGGYDHTNANANDVTDTPDDADDDPAYDTYEPFAPTTAGTTEPTSNPSTLFNPFTFNIADKVEVYWTGEKQWFGGEVLEKRERMHTIAGKRVKAPEIRVHYHSDGETLWHALHNNSIRHVRDPTDPSIHHLRGDGTGGDDSFETAATCGVGRDDIFVVRDLHIDLEDGDILNKWTVFVLQEGSLTPVASSNTIDARHWHTPCNEREYARSPQQALWRTAKEQKWAEYLQLNMFDWVPSSHIDRKKYRIFNTLWAYKIKYFSDLTFNKLNPRWCFKGGSMDRDMYKAFTETLRMTSFRIIMALKAGYYKFFCCFLLDCSNAFQATRTDDDPDQPLLYCWPAPGFERYDEKGERMACKLNCGMQGRVDATRLFNDRLQKILERAECMRSLWDPQLNIYHSGPLKNTDASLLDILTSISQATDSEPQQPPIGYAVLGWHVDDSTGVAADVKLTMIPQDNRVVKFIDGTIAVTYATTLTGWKGNKSLGFTLNLDDEKQAVELSAPDALEQLVEEMVGDGIRIKPKHIWTADMNSLEPGVLPDPSDPLYNATLETMSLTRKCLGVALWIANAYPQLNVVVPSYCRNMHCPKKATFAALQYSIMHVSAHPHPSRWCTHGVVGLEQPDTLWPISDDHPTPPYFHCYSDANLTDGSTTGGVGMLACGPCIVLRQRQHLAAPDTHTAEVVAGGVGLSQVVPVNGVLQELSIRLGTATPYYLDSNSTVFVAQHDKGVKKSVWLIRRVAVITDAVKHAEIKPIHISEKFMVADAFTKYLPFTVFVRHMRVMLCIEASAPW